MDNLAPRLRHVLHDVASSAVFESPDIERLVRLGRIRARRMTAAGLGLALAVATTLLALQGDDEDAARRRLEPPATDSHDGRSEK